jgi:hypothetical protein
LKNNSICQRCLYNAVETQLPNPLKTSFNKTLNFDQEMQGKAEIVTEDMRLIERFFYQILKILKA